LSIKAQLLNVALAVLLAASGTAEGQPAIGEVLKVVVVSRHGVRSPLEPVEDLNRWTQRPGGWPRVWSPATWPHQKDGDLTQAGSALATLMGGYYRSRLVDRGLAPTGRCPERTAVFIRADVDERTQATGASIARGLARDCPSSSQFPVTVIQDGKKADPGKPVDPLFHPTAPGLVCPLGAQQAFNSIAARLPREGFVGLDKENGAAISAMQDVLQCCQSDVCVSRADNAVRACRLTDLPTRVTVDIAKDVVKMEGAIGMASAAAEIFLLEYANRFDSNDVGWGQVDVPKMARLLALHNLQFDYMQRTKYVARRQGSMLLRAVLETLLGGRFSGSMGGPMPPADAKFVAFVGHDTNIANLAALLGTDWTASDELPDKTAPAGALLFELRKHAGRRYVAAYYVAQTVKQMREQTAIDTSRPPHVVALPLPCADQSGGNTCRLVKSATRERKGSSFQELVQAAVEPACLK
jgi:4-phytase/acid phosphatase